MEVQVEKSNVVGTRVISGKTFEFEHVNYKDITRQIALVESIRWKKDIYLMQFVGKSGSQISPVPVDLEFCITAKDENNNIKGTHTHRMGFSSYTWYQNTARQLIILAGSGITTAAPEIDSNKNDSSALYMKHFHNCTIDSFGNIVRITTQPFHRTHSFFGQLYYYPSSSDITPVVHPLRPNSNPNA